VGIIQRAPTRPWESRARSGRSGENAGRVAERLDVPIFGGCEELKSKTGKTRVMGEAGEKKTQRKKRTIDWPVGRFMHREIRCTEHDKGSSLRNVEGPGRDGTQKGASAKQTGGTTKKNNTRKKFWGSFCKRSVKRKRGKEKEVWLGKSKTKQRAATHKGTNEDMDWSGVILL